MTEFVNGNRITLLRNGAEYFPALEAECDAARYEVHLETYIFEDDETGQRIAEALKRAARRGVVVHVLIDGFGSKELNPELVAGMRQAGVQIMIYRPEFSPWVFHRHRLRRLHRKLAVIDARVAFVGGINIIDDMHTPGHTPPRHDYAVKVEGPLLRHIHPVVARLWTLVTWTQFKQRWRKDREIKVRAEPCGVQRAAFVVRDNLRHRRDIEEEYLAAIARARSEIIIACAYFFPGVSFRRALIEAAARGVRVVLLLQGRVEYVLLHYASRALYGAFLDAGIEIHEYHKSFLHAKVAVVDRCWATVGSSNIDPLSLLHAREANVVVQDADFAAELHASLKKAMADGAREVRRERWKVQPLPFRIVTWLYYGLVRLLTGISAYGRAREFR
ncbi:MAG: cardiolipin synthase ClsB [Betaproteobacteria bacterium]|nr:cardiolipin synthase ClsB [Betaproteobacteria bacterium]MBI3938752.1 cardiolipin synthase ClsB [Betaproteobacteria bacterium]